MGADGFLLTGSVWGCRERGGRRGRRKTRPRSDVRCAAAGSLSLSPGRMETGGGSLCPAAGFTGFIKSRLYPADSEHQVLPKPCGRRSLPACWGKPRDCPGQGGEEGQHGLTPWRLRPGGTQAHGAVWSLCVQTAASWTSLHPRPLSLSWITASRHTLIPT